jgi:hypothetical protein
MATKVEGVQSLARPKYQMPEAPSRFVAARGFEPKARRVREVYGQAARPASGARDKLAALSMNL